MTEKPIDDVLGKLEKVTPAGKNQWQALCPAHGDRSPSLSISVGDDGRVLVCCHAGCSFGKIVEAMGLKQSDLFPPGSGRKKPRQRSSGPGKIVAEYNYRDENGVLLYQVVRYEPKGFRQRRPDGQGRWIYNMQDVDRVLYRLPELHAADPNEIIYICEGEKDADNLAARDFVTTTSPQGAGKWHKLKDDSVLHGRKVVILPDKDAAGAKHAEQVAALLYPNVAEVRIVQMPCEGNDVSDCLEQWKLMLTPVFQGMLHDIVQITALWEPKTAAEARDEPGEPLQDDESCQIGDIDPESQKIILSVKEPLRTARAFLDHRYDAGGIKTLRRFQGGFLRWRGGRYEPFEHDALRADLYKFTGDALDGVLSRSTGKWRFSPFAPTKARIDALVDALAAETNIASMAATPLWLDGYDNPPPVTELVPHASGLLHLPSMKALAATPAFFNTTVIPTAYDPAAPSPAAWLGFLEQLWPGDPGAVELLRQWFGYVLTSDTRLQKMLLVIGPRRSGKGTIGRILRALLGRDSVVSPTTSSLAGMFGLQPLLGKTLALVSDARFGGRHESAVVLERLLCISGEDALTVPRKYRADVTLKLSARFMFLTNELPRLTDQSQALSSRFLVLRLTRSFLGKEDTDLSAKLCAELPGIFKWAVEGWHALGRQGRFVQPASGEQAALELEDLGSPMGAFVRDRCVRGLGYETSIGELFEAWLSWCREYGRDHPGTLQTFGRDLSAAVPDLQQSRPRDAAGGRRRRYVGIALRTAAPGPRRSADQWHTHINQGGTHRENVSQYQQPPAPVAPVADQRGPATGGEAARP